MKRLIEGFLPENLMWRGGKAVLGKALGWATHSSAIMGIVKGVALNPITWLVGASVGAFMAMGNEISDTIDKVRDKQEKALLGRSHKDSLKKFQRIKNEFEGSDSGFVARNRNLILHATRAGGQAAIQEDGTLDVNAILHEAAKSSANDEREKAEFDKIIDVCADESKELDRERKLIGQVSRDLARNKNVSEQDKLQLGCDMDMMYNGEHVKMQYLPDGTPNPMEIRTRNLIGRTQLLQMLKDRKFRDDPKAPPNAEAEIKKYREAASRLLVVNSGKAAVNEGVLGTKMKFFGVDTGRVFGKNGKPTGKYHAGWEILHEGASYGFREVDAGEINWSDPRHVQAVLYNTIGQITQESETREQASMFGSLDTKWGEDRIEKPLFLELCDIFIDMMCKVTSHITAPGYASPRTPSHNLDMILKSERIESRVKYAGVEYDSKDQKLKEFFNMLVTRSEKFRGYIGDIVRRQVVNMIGNGKDKYVVMSSSNVFSDARGMVCLTPIKHANRYTLYKSMTTLTMDEYQRRVRTNNLPEAKYGGGDRFCYIVKFENDLFDGNIYQVKARFVKNVHEGQMEVMAGELAQLLIPYI